MEYYPIDREDDQFQKPLTAHQIERVCQRALGSAAKVLSVREFDSGLFNSTYRIDLTNDSKFVFRVAPHLSSRVFFNEKDLLRREYTLHPYFGAISNLIPKIVFADFSHELLNRDYIFQSYLEGDLWDEIQDELNDGEINGLWYQLGEIAKQIHNTPGKEFGYPYPGKRYDRWSKAVESIVIGMRNDLIDLHIDTSGVKEYVDLLGEGQPFLDQIDGPSLLHGDLWPKNVLIKRGNQDPQIIGLLDSERGLWGDPMAEWIFHYWEIPGAFWEAYGGYQEDRAARFRKQSYWGMYSIQLLLEALRFNLDESEFRANLFSAIREMRFILSQK